MSDFIEETIEIEVEEAPIVASDNEIIVSHSKLTNIELPDQHPIKAITGLSDKLTTIESLKETESAGGKGYAEYWVWLDKNDITEENSRDKIGRFVSLVQNTSDNNTYIKISNADDPQIFGVIVPKNTIAFIGNEEWNPIFDEQSQTISRFESTRDYTYGLVGLVGSVKVRYATNANELDIKVGDYVKPSTDGYAVKAENNDGLYRVINAGMDDYYGYYAEINLSISASDVDNISVKHAKSADNYTESGTIKQKLDDLDDRIDTEIDNIENGATIVGKAKNFDEAEGTIKDKFDETNTKIDNEINKLTSGTTVAKNATNAVNSDYINIRSIEDNVVKPYSIKTCTTDSLENMTEPLSDSIYIVTDDTAVEDLVDWKAGVEDGTVVVPSAERANYAFAADEADKCKGWSKYTQFADADQFGNIIDETYITKSDAQETYATKSDLSRYATKAQYFSTYGGGISGSSYLDFSTGSYLSVLSEEELQLSKIISHNKIIASAQGGTGKRGYLYVDYPNDTYANYCSTYTEQNYRYYITGEWQVCFGIPLGTEYCYIIQRTA